MYLSVVCEIGPYLSAPGELPSEQSFAGKVEVEVEVEGGRTGLSTEEFTYRVITNTMWIYFCVHVVT